MLNQNEQRVLSLLESNPFLSQQELADQLELNRSTVATVISNLVSKKYLLGRAYVVNQASDVVCIGGMNIDRKYRMVSDLMAKTSNPVSSSMSLGGVSRNIAENLGRLGQSVTLLSVAGYDHDYEWIKSQTEGYVNMQHITQLEGHATSSYSAILDQNGDMQLALADMAICDAMTPDWLRSFQSVLKQARLVVLDLNLPQATVAQLLTFAKQEQLEVVIIPVSSPKMAHLPRELSGVTWLIVNQDESETFFGCSVQSESDFTALADKWLATGVQQVLITRGKQSSYYANQSGTRQYFEPPLVEKVVDVTGAGDSFASGIVYGHLQGQSPQVSIAYGLCNAYQTIQSSDTVRKNLSQETFEQEYQTLTNKGAI